MAEAGEKGRSHISAVAVAASAAWNAGNIRDQLRAATSAKKGRLILTAKIAAFGALCMMLRGAKNVLLASLLYAAVASVLSHFKDIKKYPAFWRAVQIEQSFEAPTLASLRRNIPTDFDGSDVSKFILFGAMSALALVLRGAAFKFAGDVEILRRKRDALTKASSLLSGNKLDRSKLLEVYAEVRKSLDEHKQNLAFLSIDVVDSTGMKSGEDPGIAENDFRQYKRLVENIVGAHQAVKSAWTPDGVMICFPSAAQAASAAQGVIIGLDEFNRSVKHIKRDFAIRAGINSGDVFCDANTPMEEMTDRVIDIAGHMQKHGIVNGIAIAKHAIEPYLDEFSFKDANRAVDSCPVYEWKKDGAARPA